MDSMNSLLLWMPPDRPLIVGSKPRSSGWEKFEKDYVAVHNFCVACGGTKLLQVHHKLPYHLHPELELDENNVMTLCMSPGHLCHFIYGHCRDWLAFNPRVVEMAAEMLEATKNRKYA